MHGRALLAAILAAALGSAAAVPAGAAINRPELVLQAGRTFAVGSKVADAFDQGGFSATGGVLWPWENRFRFGVVAFAADLGDKVGPVVLPDAGGGPGKDYGTVEFGHRGTWGAAWRVDALGPNVARLGRGYATASYGYFRFTQDYVGHLQSARSAVGGSLGIGLERTLNPRHAVGVTAGATWMSDDFTRRYANAALEWRWRW